VEFNELGLLKKLIKAITELGYTAPTPIQEMVIPHILADTGDLVGLAHTGTGKTAAFGLPLIQKIIPEDASTQGLILCPTRELCLQSYKFLKDYTKYIKRVRVSAVYGGTNIVQQIKELEKGAHIIVATPGRLLDLVKRKKADISMLKYFILDEADIMLDMGFKDELDAIFQAAGEERKVFLFSATMPPEVEDMASGYMKDPEEITIGVKNAGIQTIEDIYVMVHAKDKYLALKRIVDFYPGIYGIVFCRTRISTKEIAEKMIKDGYNAEALHGDLSQVQREYVMQKFRKKNIQLLIATDVAARGLDVNNLTHIIHYDLPDKTEVYTHRSGRTGRIGKKGISYAIINLKEKYKLRDIEKTIQRTITQTQVPAGSDICEQQLMHLIDRVKSVEVDTEQIAPYMPVIEEKLASLDREELLQHFVSLEFNRFLNYYKNTPDLTPVKQKGKRQKKSKRDDTTAYVPININVGRKDRITPPDIIGLINQSTRCRHIKIGHIDMSLSTSTVEIEEAYLHDVIWALEDFTFKGRRIKVQIGQKKQKKKRSGRKRSRRSSASRKKKNRFPE
jgi:ATP-dependent RNA helicase DeaD